MQTVQMSPEDIARIRSLIGTGSKVHLEILQERLSSEDYKIALACINPRTGELRASSPNPKPRTEFSGLAYFAWRMSAFICSSNPQHHCMPTTVDMYLPDLPELKGRNYWEKSEEERERNRVYRKALEVRGQHIADEICDAIDPTQHHGLMRWGNALGYLS